MSFAFTVKISWHAPGLVTSLVFRWTARAILRFWLFGSFCYVGFPQIGRLVAAPWISSIKSETRSEKLPGFLALVFSWGLSFNIYMRFSIATSYSLLDGFCCVLTKLKPPNDSGRKLQHPDFSIRASASGLRHPGSSR